MQNLMSNVSYFMDAPSYPPSPYLISQYCTDLEPSKKVNPECQGFFHATRSDHGPVGWTTVRRSLRLPDRHKVACRTVQVSQSKGGGHRLRQFCRNIRVFSCQSVRPRSSRLDHGPVESPNARPTQGCLSDSVGGVSNKRWWDGLRQFCRRWDNMTGGPGSLK